MSVDYRDLPLHMQDAAREYVEHGQPPGGFFRYVLENRLAEACRHADNTNIHYMREWANWLYGECPIPAWGSPAEVDEWINKHAAKRAEGKP